MPVSLVIQTSFLGDTVLTTPLIAELSSRGVVDVVTTPAGARVLSGNPFVRRVVVFDKGGADSGASGLKRLAGAVRAAGRDDVAYLAQGSWRSAALALLAGYHTRVGFDTSAGRWLYTRRVRYLQDRHHAERLWRLAGHATGAPAAEALRPRLYPSDADRAAVGDLVRTAGAAGETLVALAPGSIWATKRWPHYSDLARRLTSVGRVVIIGGADDAPLAREIVDATFGAAIDATGKLTLLGSAALLARCAVLVTNDSAPQHLASAVGTPTITIFGPTVPRFGFGPLAARSRTIGHQTLTCRPCHPHGPPACPLGHWRCMRELDMDVVRRTVDEVLFDRRHG